MFYVMDRRIDLIAVAEACLFLVMAMMAGCVSESFLVTRAEEPPVAAEPPPGPPKVDQLSRPPEPSQRSPAAPTEAEMQPPPQITEKELPEPPVVEQPLPSPSVKGSQPPVPGSERPVPQALEKKEEREDLPLLNPAVPEDARMIQTRLSELRFYDGPIDGIWGKASRTALIAFKESNALGSSEKWDKEVQTSLFRRTAQTEQPPPEADKDPISTGILLLDTSVPQDARKIQNRLSDLGLYRGPIDGIWGSGSRAGLRSFKQEHSLKNPDKWDRETQILLFGKSNP